MKRLVRLLAWIAAVAMGLRLIGELMRKRFEEGTSPDDDVFRLAAFVGGVEAVSRATALRSVTVKVVCGGIALDLQEATLAEEGAVVDVDLSMGGLAMTVASGWRVDVDSTLAAGDVSTELADPESLPEDAPRLLVRVRGRAGGVAVSGS